MIIEAEAPSLTRCSDGQRHHRTYHYALPIVHASQAAISSHSLSSSEAWPLR